MTPAHSLHIQKILFTATMLAVFFCVGAQPLYADSGSLSVTITPPLFQLSIGPGEAWASSLKIVNNNTYDVTYYSQVVDMQANGENGGSKFIPIIDESQDPTQQAFEMARWVQLPPEPLLVKAGAAANLPFTLTIPDTAEPGGHYAAILIGTEPPSNHASGTVLKVSSYVSSLLFVNIKGEVNESGRIREFITSQSLYQTPKVDFTLRFENTGSTHVRPQGQINIYNMWGMPRGAVAINQDSDSSFGNVLPKSVRRFQFSWEGDGNPFDIGLYSAEVTLAFGQGGKQNVSSKTYFWVVPVVPVAIGSVMIILFIGTIMWLIRRYIRRALQLEQGRYGTFKTAQTPAPVAPPSIIETLIEPVRVGVIDLRSVGAAKSSPTPSVAAINEKDSLPRLTIGEFAAKYKLFLVFLAVVLVGLVGIWLYFDKVLTPQRGFQITDVHIQAEDAPTGH